MRLRGIISLIMVAGAWSACAKEFEIRVEGCGHAVLVSLPEGHDPAEKRPAVFYYHGLNGKPRTDWMRMHTGPGHWIVVGMAYVQQGQYSMTVDALKREIAALREVRDRLARSQGLDPKRVFVVGLSKGGWMVDHLLQAERSLAGGALLMGGHILDLPPNPKPYRKGKPVFIGVGRKDGNYPFSLRALQFHRKLGAEVHFESWDNLAHSSPKSGSAGLKEWLALLAGRELDEAELDGEMEEILGLPPAERWWRLMQFKDRPAVTADDSPWKGKVDAALAELKSDPDVVRESALFREHRQLLARELKSRTVPEMEQVLHDYLVLVGKAEGSIQLDFVENDLGRVQGVMGKVGERRVKPPATPGRREVKPEFPEPRRRVPLNPLVR